MLGTASNPPGEWIAYDPLSRATRSTVTGNTDYYYTATGERILRVNSSGSTYTFRDTGDRIATEYAGTTPSRDNVFLGNHLVGSYSNSTVSGNGPPWLYYSSDHLGTPRLLTDNLGFSVESRRSWPFGEDVTPPNTFQRLRYATMERDPEGQRYYDHARSHSFGLARFMSPDKLGGKIHDPQSWNQYTYTRNNPLKYVDPDGLQSISYQRQQAVAQAWGQERQMVIAFGRGTRQWSQAEMQELMATGRVQGYYGHHINNVASSPGLAGEAGNIDFVTSPEHYARHNNGRFRLPTSGSLITRGVVFLQMALLAVDAWSRYKEASATGISTSIFGTTAIFDAAAAARTLNGTYISVSENLGGLLQARDGAFYRAGCEGTGDACKVDSKKLAGENFSVVPVY